MSSWQIVLTWLAPMAVLALLSALFSGSEAALFSLRDRDLRELRRHGSAGKLAVNLVAKPERLLWWALKGDQTGFHFRKQHAAGPFVLDFYCDWARLCVEVDGASHDFTVNRDAGNRDAGRTWNCDRQGQIAAREPL